jgi:hypothetical protein
MSVALPPGFETRPESESRRFVTGFLKQTRCRHFKKASPSRVGHSPPTTRNRELLPEVFGPVMRSGFFGATFRS